MNMDPNKDQLPLSFNSAEKWPGKIHEPLDQGNCAASWAFSTAGTHPAGSSGCVSIQGVTDPSADGSRTQTPLSGDKLAFVVFLGCGSDVFTTSS